MLETFANDDADSREHEIRVLAERFLDVAEIGPQWFWEFDSEFRYIYLSERGLQMYGMTKEEIYGRTREQTVRPRMTPVDLEEQRQHDDDIRNRRPFRNHHYVLRRLDGTDAHILTSGKPYFDADGVFRGYRGVSVDITEQVTAETRLRAAIEAIEDGFAYFDAEERFVLCNSKYLDFYREANKILLPGTTFEHIVRNGVTKGFVRNTTPGIEEFVADRMRKFRAGNVTFDSQIADGRWLRVQDRRTPDGGTACFRVDITDLKRREAMLMREREKSDAANRAKTEFLSSMSHELRTPMNAILGFGQLIEQKGAKLTPEKIADFAHHIVRSGRHLLDLLGDVLELSKIESGHANLTIENVAAAPLIAECLEMVEAAASEAEVALIDRSDPSLPFLATDAGRFRQIILNLLSNAVKYNRAGGTVTISTEVQGKQKVRVSVIDTGDGIPADRQTQIFQPFNRLGREAGEIEGTGIGLYLTHRLVERLGGAMGFSSAAGLGSTFWVDFPLGGRARAAERAPSSRAPARPADPNDRSLVLYVEDNPLHRLLMEEIFVNLPSMNLVAVETAEEGLALVAKSMPALILMDIDLPGMNGFEALSRLKESDETASIPVVAMTAGAADHDIERGLAAGFSDYLTKPIEIERLVDAVERLIGVQSGK